MSGYPNFGPPRLDFSALGGIGDALARGREEAEKRALRQLLGQGVSDPNANPRDLAGRAIAGGFDALGADFLRQADASDTRRADAAAYGELGILLGGDPGPAFAPSAGTNGAGRPVGHTP